MTDAVVVQQRYLEEFLASDAARTFAAGYLRGVPAAVADVDDLLHEVWFRVTGRLGRHGPLTGNDDAADAVRAYATRVMRNTVVSWLRASPRRSLHVSRTEEDGEATNLADPAATDPAALAGELFDDLRRSLHRQVRHAQAWRSAAALTWVTIAQEPALTVGPAVPRPEGDNWDAHAEWASLHYAGRHDCFGAPDTAAVRQRRSRAIRAVKDELASAGRKAGLRQEEPT